MAFPELHVPKILTQAKERAADSGAKAGVLNKNKEDSGSALEESMYKLQLISVS
jgi:hypothetical protein